MPKFVILTHDHPALHWDLMLEVDGVLKTWRLSSQPALNLEIVAESRPDHRLHYLTYEGPVSGDRGTVLQWDVGTFQYIDPEKPQRGVMLQGNKLVGLLKFIQHQNELRVVVSS